MKVTVKPVVIDAFVTIPKGFVKGLEDLRIRKTSEDYPDIVLRSARILRGGFEDIYFHKHF